MGSFNKFDKEVLLAVNTDLMSNFEKPLERVLGPYCKELIEECLINGEYYEEDELRAKL